MPGYSKTNKRGKDSTLIQTRQTRIKYSNDAPLNVRKLDRAAMEAAFKSSNLEARLSALQKAAEHILKSHDKPHTFPFPPPPEVINTDGKVELKDVDLTNDENYQVSYAADILIDIHRVRNWVEKGNAENAAYEALKLGQHVTLLIAEDVYKAKNRARSKGSVKERAKNAKNRQREFKKVTDALGFISGNELDRSQKKKARDEFREKYPKYEKSPLTETLNDDLKEIGFKFK